MLGKCVERRCDSEALDYPRSAEATTYPAPASGARCRSSATDLERRHLDVWNRRDDRVTTTIDKPCDTDLRRCKYKPAADVRRQRLHRRARYHYAFDDTSIRVGDGTHV